MNHDEERKAVRTRGTSHPSNAEMLHTLVNVPTHLSSKKQKGEWIKKRWKVCRDVDAYALFLAVKRKEKKRTKEWRKVKGIEKRKKVFEQWMQKPFDLPAPKK